MYLEVSQEKRKNVIDFFNRNNIEYKESDATLPNEVIKTYHLEFPDLSKDQLIALNLLLDNKKVIEKRHKPWNDSYHTLNQEIKGFMTGEAEKEDVTYEQENY